MLKDHFYVSKFFTNPSKSESATIINIGSVVAYKGYMDQSVYASSKHALAGMTKSIGKKK